jgi:predicted amidophosphoribosyltransferase
MEPYVGHPYEVIGRIRLDEALAKAELARLLREQPDRVVRHPSLRDRLAARLQNRPARIAATRSRAAMATGRVSAGQASLGVFDA